MSNLQLSMEYVAMSQTDNVILDKTYRFAINIIGLHRTLNKKRAYTISRQVLKSGTSIGANLEEAAGSYSRKEFAAKISIAYKEARETKFWLRLLRDTHYIDATYANTLISDCVEILKILAAIRKTLRNQSS